MLCDICIMTCRMMCYNILHGNIEYIMILYIIEYVKVYYIIIYFDIFYNMSEYIVEYIII